MKQWDKGVGIQIDARQIGPFVEVASITGKRQAIGVVRTPVLFRHNMFQVERNNWGRRLREPTILTGMPSPIANQIASSLVQLKRPDVKGIAGLLPA